MKLFITILTLTIAVLDLRAQTIDFAAPVTMQYSGDELGAVIQDITTRYGVKFSYSPQIIPLEKEIYVDIADVGFSEALDVLFENTSVIYGFIGDQIVLSIDPELRGDLMMPQAEDDPLTATEQLFGPRTTFEISSITSLSHTGTEEFDRPFEPIFFGDDYIAAEADRLMRIAEREQNAFRAQITFFPPLQLITKPNVNAPVNVSLNVMAGVNDNIEGLELGGLANIVRGNVTGLQAAGILNTAGYRLRGVQAAGVANVARLQSSGLQAAGVANVASQGGEIVQIGGVSSYARGTVLGQVSGVFNSAEYIEGIQLSGVFNFANYSFGQIGLINFADSSEFSVGLLSFIRDGYKSVEVAGEETMHVNLNFRTGGRYFYNILHLSATYDISSWAFGYGIGSSFPIGSKKNYVQLELMSRQISEGESWTNALNLLNQFNINWDIQLGGGFSLALGPTLNVMVSQRYAPDTDSWGSELPPYTIFDETFSRDGRGDPTNIKGWLGFRLGVRYSVN